MTHLAGFGGGQAFLYTEFGENLARKYFGNEIVDSLPRFTRGKRAGKIKDHEIVWTKVTRGGWVRTSRATASGDASGYVENRVGSIIEAELNYRPFRGEAKTIKTYRKPRE